jgi:hypothetical protein
VLSAIQPFLDPLDDLWIAIGKHQRSPFFEVFGDEGVEGAPPGRAETPR